jgi:hypothetical protein
MAHSSGTTNKVSRHRARMRAAGLRPVQFWVPDTRNPEVATDLQRQCLSLKDDKAEAEVLGFTEAAATGVEGWV